MSATSINTHTHIHRLLMLFFFFLVPHSGSIVQQLRLHNGKTSHFHYVYSLNYFLFFLSLFFVLIEQ